jgi:hypothetical protein
MGWTERPLFQRVCAIVFSMLLGFSGGPAVSQRVAKRKIACKTPQNAGSCYWAHGRLSLYDGTPSYRLWKTGTRRILGIYSGPEAERRDPLDNEHPEFPTNLDRAFKTPYSQIFADFEICPLESERPGEMQAACIESAKNLVVR